LTLVDTCGKNRNRRGRTGYVANPRKESEPMKVLWILRKVTALTLLMALGGAGADAQAEIDQDQFDSLNTEPFDQPKTQSQAHATRYDGHFSLPCAVRCSGKQLALGKYSVSRRSDGKVDHGVLKSISQFIEITSVVHPQGSKRGADVVVVGSNGKVRALSAIQVAGVNFLFDPIFQRERIHRNTAIDTSEFQQFAKPRERVSSPHSFRRQQKSARRHRFRRQLFLKFAHDPTGSC
jgi:hypothetical protein